MNKLIIIFLLILPFLGLSEVMHIYFKHEIKLLKKYHESLFNFKCKVICRISLSIIIAVFNKYKYLSRSFNSMINQSYQNYEIIYIDDYSSDQSSDFILQKMAKDKRIKLIQHTYNQGICNTRIHGVLHSKGDYIMTLDPDDVFFLNTFNFSYHKAIEMQSDIIDILVEFREGRSFIRPWHPCKKKTTQIENQYLQIFNFSNFKIHLGIYIEKL